MSVLLAHAGWASSASISAQEENEPPIVSCSIRNGSKVSGQVELSGRAFDIDGSVELVEVRIDDGEWHEAAGSETWRYNWNSERSGLGWHTISVRSYDGKDHSAVLQVQVVVEEPGEGIDKFAGLVQALAVAGVAIGITVPLIHFNRERLRAFAEIRFLNPTGIDALACSGRGRVTQAYGEAHPVRRCEVCGRSKLFYPQYRRYYCHRCGQYR